MMNETPVHFFKQFVATPPSEALLELSFFFDLLDQSGAIDLLVRVFVALVIDNLVLCVALVIALLLHGLLAVWEPWIAIRIQLVFFLDIMLLVDILIVTLIKLLLHF